MNDIPKWAELPDLELYLDQLLIMVNQLVVGENDLADKGLTAAMVNNYVKHHYLTKPVKKKYQKHQLARLIAITFLKNVFSIQEITQTLDMLSETYSSQELYDYFVAAIKGDQDEKIPEVIRVACQTVKYYEKTRLLYLTREEN